MVSSVTAVGSDWLEFERVEATRSSIDGAPRAVAAYAANRDGTTWLFYVHLGGRLIDTSTHRLFLVEKAGYRSRHGAMEVDLAAMQPAGDGGCNLTHEGDVTRVEAWLDSRWVRFEVPRIKASAQLQTAAGGPAGSGQPADPAPEPSPVSSVSSEDELRPLDHGLMVKVPKSLGVLPEIAVSKLATTAEPVAGLEPLGPTYRIVSEGGELSMPVELHFPLPSDAVSPSLRVYARQTGDGGTAFLPAVRVDLERGVAVVRTRRFSDWALYGSSDDGSGSATLSGFITVAPGCDENPSYAEVTVVCENPVGPTGRFLDVTGGISSYRIVVPESFFGECTFKYVTGASFFYWWGVPQPLPSVAVLEAGVTHTNNFELEPTTARMTGVVRDQDGEPIPGARVYVFGNEGQRYAGLHADQGGRYDINQIGICEAGGPTTATMDVQIIHPDRETCKEMNTRATLDACVANQRDFEWKALGNVSGMVDDEEGNPIDGARVRVTAEDGSVTETLTDFGSYLVKDVPEGEATVVVTCPEDEESQSRTVEVECDRNTLADFVMECCANELYGMVRDTDGLAVSGAAIAVKDAEGARFSTTTDGSGSFTVKELSAGVASVTATCPDQEDSDSRSVEIVCNEPVAADFELECCTGDLDVFVEDEDGEVVDGAFVTIQDAEHSIRRGIADLGLYQSRDLAVGLASVKVECPDKQDTASGTVEIGCMGLHETTLVLNCSGTPGLQGTIEVQRGIAGAMEATLEGGFDLQMADDESVQGSGTGVMTIQVVGDGGRCSGRQNVAISARGQVRGETLELDLDFDDGGRSMRWTCEGGKPVGIDGLVSFEDEGQGLKLSITSDEPFHASIERAAGNVPFGTRLSVTVNQR